MAAKPHCPEPGTNSGANKYFRIITFLAGLLALWGCAGPPDRDGAAPAFAQRTPVKQGLFLQDEDFASGATPSEEEVLPDNALLEDYVRFAVHHHPDLSMAFYRWRAAVEQIRQERSLPDPRVSFGMVFDQVESDPEYMGERYMLEQMFPWFGKLVLGGDIATTRSRAEARRLAATHLQVVEQVTLAFVEYAFQQHAVLIAKENLELLTRLETVARAMLRAGTASLADVSRAQIEMGRIDNQRRSLEDFQGVATAELNTALGRAAQASLPRAPARPSALEFADLPEYSEDQWFALIRQHNPELAALRDAAEQQRQEVSLARKNYYPDLSVGVEYGRNLGERMAMMDGGGTDMVEWTISLNVPIWHGKYDAGVRETLARSGEAQRQIESRGNRLETELKTALYTYRDSLRKVSLYGDNLLPMAEQTLATTETAYRAGTAGFSDLIDAHRVLLEFSLAHERAAADRFQAAARIQALAGLTAEWVPMTEPLGTDESSTHFPPLRDRQHE